MSAEQIPSTPATGSGSLPAGRKGSLRGVLDPVGRLPERLCGITLVLAFTAFGLLMIEMTSVLCEWA